MAQGLQIWDAAGNLIFDTNTLAPRILTSIAIGTTNGSQSVSVPAGNNVVAQPRDSSVSAGVSGGTLSWNWGTTPSGLRNADTIDLLLI